MANDLAYHFHYVDLDSTLFYANLAYDNSAEYPEGRMEALNNLAFVDIVKMHYDDAEEKLLRVLEETDNQIELLVANVQMMRLCQRKSENKDFYSYYWHAQMKSERIKTSAQTLDERQRKRVLYAETEMLIILSAYLYYVEQIDASVAALSVVENSFEIQKDTAQLLNYFYNVGSGSFIRNGTAQEIAQREIDYLLRCYFTASRSQSVFWQANALQAISEHLQKPGAVQELSPSNLQSIRAISDSNIEDSLLAGSFALRSASLFADYGDTYQTAAALRTLSDCYFHLEDNETAIACLLEALERDTLINQSPSMVSSLYEKLSINYSAIDENESSNFFRTKYLDIYDNTRQDRELEARADQLKESSTKVEMMIWLVCLAIIVEISLLFYLTRKLKRNERATIAEQLEDIAEQQKTVDFLLDKGLRTNVEHRAKMTLVNNVMPLIDRMIAEINFLMKREEDEKVEESRFAYIAELADKINEYNNVLTEWIQLRRGELSMRIESFRLQDLFDMVKKGRMSFAMKNIELEVADTPAVVKADKALTLFMINTIADNARKATPEGGRVKVEAEETDSYVEVSISDNGAGMDEEQLANIFNHQPSVAKQHGFGLMNCKGIIEKYRKVSSLFSVCSISAESKKGEGSTLRFRLPRGVLRMMMLVIGLCAGGAASASADLQTKAQMFVDSVFFSNLQGHYEKSIAYADSARNYFNERYKELRPEGSDYMEIVAESVGDAAELRWHSDSLNMNYGAILDLRNETAVAAMALHRWDIYLYNNKVHSRLFRDCSSDLEILTTMKRYHQQRESNNVAIILLVCVLLLLFPTYYFLMKESFNSNREQRQKIDLAIDDLQRLRYEIDNLHVNNNVLDNCFSALKHETMYFPSRIRQLVGDRERSVAQLAELLTYYKELYSILSLQAQRQVESRLKWTPRLKAFLLDLLRKIAKTKDVLLKQVGEEGDYVKYLAEMPELKLTADEIADLFAPLTSNIECLVVKQIVREVGELTNKRGSGVLAELREDGGTNIVLTLPRNLTLNV